MKCKKSVEELIEHMKDKGITFNYYSERNARHYLSEHTYYYKLSSYRKNYVKNRKGKYVNLDFEYLKELSIIDMYLRKIIFSMAVDIEHALKVLLIKEVEKNKHEDGYQICTNFLKKYPEIETKIQKNKNSSYCQDIIKKYSNGYPIWALCELISFGDLIKLYKYYFSNYGINLPLDSSFLYPVRALRNATAHNNCLINNLHAGVSRPTFKPNQKLRVYLAMHTDIGLGSISKKISNQSIHDFVSLLYCYDKLVRGKVLKSRRFEELENLFQVRMRKNSIFFQTNQLIVSNYHFCKRVLEHLKNS